MAWRDRLQKGSFRGAAFLWERAETEVGRKASRHDYPFRDDAYMEDMGKVPREFILEVYVLGPDYIDARDRLIAALEIAGPGTLVHPTWGTLQVCLTSKVRVSESTDQGGMARFSLPFILAGDNKQPTAVASTAAVVTKAAARVKAAAAAAAILDLTNAPLAKPSRLSLAQKSINAVSAITRQVNAVKGTISTYMNTILDIQSAVNDLVAAPALLVQAIQGMLLGLAALVENPLPAVSLYASLFDFGGTEPAIATTTPRRTDMAATQAAVVELVRASAIAEAATQAASADYASYQEATATRDTILAAIDTVAETSGDELYTALMDLRAAVVNDIRTRGAQLARLVTYTPATTLPALVIAHRLYGDASRADEIISRNRLPRPGFVRGGASLEVLNG